MMKKQRFLPLLFVCVLSLSLSVPAFASENFTDVSSNAYYAEAIRWAINEGITNGIGNNQFGTGRGVTRAEAVTFLWRAANRPSPKGTGEVFTDLDPNQTWYHDAIRWAVEQGITNGVGDNKFNPNGNVTNQEMITFLYRAKGSPNYTGQGQWYSDAVRWANSKGLFNGMPTKPNVETRENCLRENVVYFLWMEMQSANTGNGDSSQSSSEDSGQSDEQSWEQAAEDAENAEYENGDDGSGTEGDWG